MTTLYVAGPMRGIPEFNFPAFFDAEMTLRGWGFEVVNPARRDVELGFDYKGLTGHEDLTTLGFDLRQALGWDLGQIASCCDGIVALDGWHKSKGAKAEVATAVALDLPVHSLPGWIEVARAERKGSPPPGLFEERGVTSDGDTVLSLIHQRAQRRATLGLRPAPDPQHTTPTVGVGGEVRLTDPNTGGQKGQKPAQLGTIDPRALLVLGEVSGFGAQKYEAFNYLKGYDWRLSLDAALRHLLAFWDGEDNDPESGLPHTAHFAWHGLALTSFLVRGLGTDTRFKGEENAA